MAASLPAGLNSSAQPSPHPRNSYSSNHTSARPSREDIRKEVEDEIRNLHSEDPVKVAKAAAGLVMLATLPAAEPYLLPAVTQLSMLLENALSIDVQRNACAALTAIMNANIHLYTVVVESPHLMERLLQCLEKHDKGLQINVVAALLLFAARLDEEITDAVCALAVHQEMRLQLVTKGAVSRLAAKLNTGSSEICVRVLLGLGMLCGSSQEAQEQLAETDGAVFMLLSLITSSDPDIRAIAHDLFAALSSNEQVKVKIEQLLRSNPVIRGR